MENDGQNMIKFRRPTKVSEMVLKETSEKLVFIQDTLAEFKSIAENVSGRLRLSLPMFSDRELFIAHAKEFITKLLSDIIEGWNTEVPETELEAWLKGWGALCQRFIEWRDNDDLHCGFAFNIFETYRTIELDFHKVDGKVMLCDGYIDVVSLSSIASIAYMHEKHCTPRDLYTDGKIT